MWFVLRAEYHKFKGFFKRYYLDAIGEIASYAILFIGLFYTIFQDEKWTVQSLFQLLTGIFIWYIGINAIAVFSFILQEEMTIGTLEQIYLTRTPLVKMLVGRAIGTFIFDMIGGGILTGVTCVFIFVFTSFDFSGVFQMEISWWALTIVILFTMIGIYGFSFLLAGLSLVFKKIGAFTIILNYIFLFFTGITISQQTLPLVIDIFSKCLPITWGNINLKSIVLSETSLIQLIATSDFWFLVLNSLLYLIIGIFVFHLLERKARKNGKLGSYY